jgi:erythromycin esterase-like protein
MTARFAAAVFALPLFLCAQTPSPVSDWIKSKAIPLATPEAGHGFADMHPLKNVIGNARIVSLGEATHGTREFFQAKHRMMEFLANEMGFTLFSIEANMPEAYRLNEYVLNGKGDPAALIKGMYFWTWDTQEVLAMVQWMREFNQSGKGHVEFTGFDMQTPNVALRIATEFLKQHGDTLAASASFAEASKMALAPPQGQQQAAGFGVATGTFPIQDAAGKHLKFSGYIKTEGIAKGYAGLWWRNDGKPDVNGRPTPAGFDNMADRGAKGTSDWKQYQIELDIPKDIVNINFGLLFPANGGEGTAWFDDLRIELDGKPCDASAFDLDFETPRPKGFFLGGNGYQVQVDGDVFHGGKQSLRMRYVGAPPTPPRPTTDFAVASGMWKDIVTHMEESRAKYGEGKEAEWAIQNARVVLQCMQMRANLVTRDASMAANIKWILDQNPKAKIVLWAHNGHVAHGGYRGYEPMGNSLRKMFGEQMVVFGFGFNEGSFRAVETGKGLREFTVPPSPVGSIDAMLASTGIPVFTLDLRQLPKDGPVSNWFREPHQARTVGAIYSEAAADNYFPQLTAPESFDVLLFVEKTAAARQIVR